MEDHNKVVFFFLLHRQQKLKENIYQYGLDRFCAF